MLSAFLPAFAQESASSSASAEASAAASATPAPTATPTPTPTPTPAPGKPGPRVLMKTTLGEIVLELNAEKAPISTNNFLSYVKSGHYNGTVFHRVIAGFMIQGGGFDKDLKQKPAGLMADPAATPAPAAKPAKKPKKDKKQ
ncbi:MAG: peptidylprolyl isomerase [Burkholderiales bacterium]|nr:peptidylprolyl isomerase [Burkholderiales bacterium]